MRKTLLVMTLSWLTSAFLPAVAIAQVSSSFANLGTSWLKISASTRDTAMGSSAGAVPDSDDEALLNPAALGLITGTHISLSQDFWAQNLSMQHLVLSQGNGGDGFSFGANLMNFGAIDTYNVSGGGSVLTSTGSYSPLGLNAYAAFGFSLSGGLRFGMTGHFIYDNIQQNFPDQTASADLGFYYQMPGSPFSVSEVLSNLGWDIDNSSLPLQIKTAAAYQIGWDTDRRVPSNKLTLSGEADWFLNGFSYTQYGLGLEYWYKNRVALRGGYQFTNFGNLTGLVGLSLGAGIKFGDCQLDYAFVSLGELGNTNQIGLSLKLGDIATPMPSSTPSPAPTPVPALAPAPVLPPAPLPIATPTPLTFMEFYRNGIQHYQAKDYDAALRDLKTAITIYDKSVRRYYYAEAFAMIGVIYKFNRPDPLAAHHYCDTALRIDPTTETAKKLRYEIDASDTKTEKKYWKGMAYYGKGQYSQAMTVLKSMVDAKDKTTPSFYYAEGYKEMGIIHEIRGEKKLAIQCFKAALKIEPKDATAQQRLDKLSQK